MSEAKRGIDQKQASILTLGMKKNAMQRAASVKYKMMQMIFAKNFGFFIKASVIDGVVRRAEKSLLAIFLSIS